MQGDAEIGPGAGIARIGVHGLGIGGDCLGETLLAVQGGAEIGQRGPIEGGDGEGRAAGGSGNLGVVFFPNIAFWLWDFTETYWPKWATWAISEFSI